MGLRRGQGRSRPLITVPAVALVGAAGQLVNHVDLGVVDGIGQQRAFVGDDLELDPVGVSASRPLRGEHRLGRAAASRGVGQRRDAQSVEQVEQSGAALGVDPADGDGGQFRARGHQRLFEHREVAGSPGPHDEPRREAAVADGQFRISHLAPPSLPRAGRRRKALWSNGIAATPRRPWPLRRRSPENPGNAVAQRP